MLWNIENLRLWFILVEKSIWQTVGVVIKMGWLSNFGPPSHLPVTSLYWQHHYLQFPRAFVWQASKQCTNPLVICMFMDTLPNFLARMALFIGKWLNSMNSLIFCSIISKGRCRSHLVLLWETLWYRKLTPKRQWPFTVPWLAYCSWGMLYGQVP